MDLTAVPTGMDSLISKVSEYNIRVHNMDIDFRRTRISISPLARDMEELEMENETIRTENVSINRQNQERVTECMDRSNYQQPHYETQPAFVSISSRLRSCDGLGFEHSYLGAQVM